MSIAANKARLRTITRDLAAEWRTTRGLWRDAKAQQFEREYMDELYAGVENATGVISQLDDIVRRIRRDCE